MAFTTRTQTPTSATRRRFEPTYEALVAKTLRVPRIDGAVPGLPSDKLVQQLDAALLSVGFKLSGDLAEHLASRSPVLVQDTGQRVLNAVRTLVGDHVAHNTYFIDFPYNVPDTMEFWVECVRDAIGMNVTLAQDEAKLVELGFGLGLINLLDLPKYGRYQHTYAEMLAHHGELIPSLKDRVTILELGDALEEESRRLYFQLAESPVPLGVDDLSLLRGLAAVHVTDGRQPGVVPVRENKAMINAVRLAASMPVLVDTPVDVLRLAAAVSDGDVTLAQPTRFRSFTRGERRVLMVALDASISRDYKLGDVPRYRERFKRLAERIHPHEYPQYPHARDVFAVARRDKVVRSLGGRVDCAIAAGQLAEAINLLSQAPGTLIRNVDYLLRLAAADPGRHAYSELLVNAIDEAALKTSTRVLLSLREHLENRTTPDVARVFVNRQGRAWVTPDQRQLPDEPLRRRICASLDQVVRDRLPQTDRLVVDPRAVSVALPLSEKTKPGGFGVLPRGSRVPVADYIRFFVYWHEAEHRTDYDLSVLLLNDRFEFVSQVSWTNLSAIGAIHSGDITESQNGASEFIDVDLNKTGAAYVIPQVDIYSGENFDQVGEAFFGYMERDLIGRGRPFEPRTVQTKSDLFGAGRVGLPLAFVRGEHGWEAKWLHLTLRGYANFNRIETNRISTALLTQSIIGRRYLTLDYLAGLMSPTVGDIYAVVDGAPCTYIGIERPDDLPEGSTAYTLQNLTDLIK